MLIILCCISIIYKVIHNNVDNLHSNAKTSVIPNSKFSNQDSRSADKRHDICISNAQYCHLSAQRNL